MEKIVWSNYADPLVLNMFYRGIEHCSQGDKLKIEDTRKFVYSYSALRLQEVRNKLKVMVDNYIVASKVGVKNDRVYENICLINTYMLSDCMYAESTVAKWYVSGEDFKMAEWIDDGSIHTTFRVLKPGVTFKDIYDEIESSGSRERVFKEYTNPIGTIVDSIMLSD